MPLHVGNGPLVGRKIVGVRTLTAQEMAEEGWGDDDPALALVLDDGELIYPSRDPEGNGPGVLFGVDATGKRHMHLPA